MGLFEVEWKTPCHNILVEFLNNWKLDFEHTKIKVMLGEKQRVIDKHLLVEILKIYYIRKTEADHVEMFDAKVELVDIANRVLDIYTPMKGGL